MTMGWRVGWGVGEAWYEQVTFEPEPEPDTERRMEKQPSEDL